MENLKTDVVVIGSGGGGLAAALTVADSGGKVTVFEEKRVIGGISKMGMEIFAVESKMLRRNNVPFTKDDAFRIFMERTLWRADARLVRAFIDKTADTIEWLQRWGVNFMVEPFFVHPDNQICTHLVKMKNGSTGPGSFGVMMNILKEKAEARGAEIRPSTPVKKIRKEGGKIVGVSAEDKAGDGIRQGLVGFAPAPFVRDALADNTPGVQDSEGQIDAHSGERNAPSVLAVCRFGQCNFFAHSCCSLLW